MPHHRKTASAIYYIEILTNDLISFVRWGYTPISGKKYFRPQIPYIGGFFSHQIVFLFDTTVLIKEIIIAFYNRNTVVSD